MRLKPCVNVIFSKKITKILIYFSQPETDTWITSAKGKSQEISIIMVCENILYIHQMKQQNCRKEATLEMKSNHGTK